MGECASQGELAIKNVELQAASKEAEVLLSKITASTTVAEKEKAKVAVIVSAVTSKAQVRSAKRIGSRMWYTHDLDPCTLCRSTQRASKGHLNGRPCGWLGTHLGWRVLDHSGVLAMQDGGSQPAFG